MAEEQSTSEATSKLLGNLGKRRISPEAFRAYLFVAVCIDLTGLPVLGTVFIAYCRGQYWLNGYQTDNMLTTTLLHMLAELLPIVPASTSFVIHSYLLNRATTKKPTEEEKENKPHYSASEKAAATGHMYAKHNPSSGNKISDGSDAQGKLGESKNPSSTGGEGSGGSHTQGELGQSKSSAGSTGSGTDRKPNPIQEQLNASAPGMKDKAEKAQEREGVEKSTGTRENLNPKIHQGGKTIAEHIKYAQDEEKKSAKIAGNNKPTNLLGTKNDNASSSLTPRSQDVDEVAGDATNDNVTSEPTNDPDDDIDEEDTDEEKDFFPEDKIKRVA